MLAVEALLPFELASPDPLVPLPLAAASPALLLEVVELDPEPESVL